jgi:hypothetical protein
VRFSGLTRDGGRLNGRVGLSGVRGNPLTEELFVKEDGVRSPPRFSLAGAVARGDSGRGSDGRLNLGRFTDGAGPGPTDLLKLGPLCLDGVGGTPVLRFVTSSLFPCHNA